MFTVYALLYLISFRMTFYFTTQGNASRRIPLKDDGALSHKKMTFKEDL